MILYALIIFIAGQIQFGWFDTRDDCVAAAREIASEVDLTAGEDDISCIAYEVTEEKKS